MAEPVAGPARSLRSVGDLNVVRSRIRDLRWPGSLTALPSTASEPTEIASSSRQSLDRLGLPTATQIEAEGWSGILQECSFSSG